MLWRLVQNWNGLLEGSCITDAAYSKLYYADRILYEPISENDILIEIKNEKYCNENNVEKLLFYTKKEVDKFNDECRDRNIS